MHISKVENKDGFIEIYFEGVGHWDDFDLILGLLQQENNCQIISNKEMIYIRKANLMWNNIKFELMQDDMLGNFIISEKNDDTQALEQLATNVINSIIKKVAQNPINENNKVRT